MELKSLYSFVKIAQLKSFTKAAVELNYAQSTISSHIQKLEHELGHKLFTRIGNNVYLTDFAKEILPITYRIFNEVEALKNCSYHDKGQIQGSVKIGTSESIMSTMLVEIISHVSEEFPNIKSSIKVGLSHELKELIEKNEIDFIITMENDFDISNYIVPATFNEKAHFIASGKNPLAYTQAKLDDLLKEKLILTNETSIFYRLINSYVLKNNKKMNTYITTDSITSILEFVNRDLGISFLPKYLIESEKVKEMYDLVTINLLDMEFDFNMYIFYHKNKWLSPAAEKMIEYTIEHWKKIEK